MRALFILQCILTLSIELNDALTPSKYPITNTSVNVSPSPSVSLDSNAQPTIFPTKPLNPDISIAGPLIPTPKPPILTTELTATILVVTVDISDLNTLKISNNTSIESQIEQSDDGIWNVDLVNNDGDILVFNVTVNPLSDLTASDIENTIIDILTVTESNSAQQIEISASIHQNTMLYGVFTFIGICFIFLLGTLCCLDRGLPTRKSTDLVTKNIGTQTIYGRDAQKAGFLDTPYKVAQMVEVEQAKANEAQRLKDVKKLQTPGE